MVLLTKDQTPAQSSLHLDQHQRIMGTLSQAHPSASKFAVCLTRKPSRSYANYSLEAMETGLQ